MKAVLTKSRHDGKVAQNRKEKHFYGQYTVLDSKDGRELVTIRVYHTNSRAYAAVWVSGDDNLYVSGGGWAGGYGYHRPSAAVDSALRDAGIKLDEAIDGRGDQAIRDAALAVAKAVRPRSKKFFQVQAYG